MERKKPRFLRKDWHKKIKLGSSVKKLRKWRAAKGRHNKIRLGVKGHSARPKIGWSLGNRKEMTDGRCVLNLDGLKGLKKGDEILIGKIGMKKRKEIVAKANEMGLKILNRYLMGNENKFKEERK